MPELDLEWFFKPQDPSAHQRLAGDVRAVVSHEVLARRLNRQDLTEEELAEAALELTNDPTVMAMIEAEALTRTAQLIDTTHQSLEYQAVQAAQSGWYGYHPARYGSPMEMLRDALQETKSGSTEYYNLRTLIEVVVPYCLRNDIPLPAAIWSDGNKAKARHLANVLNPLLKAHGVTRQNPDGVLPRELNEQLDAMLAEVVDGAVTLAQFEARHPPTPRSGLGPLSLYDYVLPEGSGVVAVLYTSPAEKKYIEDQFRRGDWHLGTGQEPFLPMIVNRRD